MLKGELPIGFTMSLAMDLEAMNCYASLPEQKQKELLSYVSRPGEGDEPKRRIDQVISQLHHHQLPDSFR
ncbi:hypothetical protein [Diplocloster agilis]|uniref:Uncharacterized protein n=1 Tax=Diplocloster agilis TaxID=2850323 RepID=A0A949K0G5_9FIRM|nr:MULTISPECIES: hypothetical protein [Lachnospiraceae]MBU9737454.1 hypothetical protein [Diplocloster agilis]MBU9745551.1 hypothetical protein [Diplocloster agilis]MCU6735148.1 hypothetical protein [Suonthocola fibrivorans]SCJ65266.1 Uncharacterised protein [uncultured Clostridium sp.]